jgi:hypothetical protein
VKNHILKIYNSMTTPTPKPISEFDELTTPTDDDLLITSSTGSSYKITRANFLGSFDNDVTYTSSLVFGQENIAESHSMVMFGSRNIAYGGESEYSNVFGQDNNVDSSISTVSGTYNTVTGFNVVASGFGNIVSGGESIGIGINNTSSDWGSLAIGRQNDATGNTSIAIGQNNNATAYCTVAIGNDNTAAGDYVICAGYDNVVDVSYDNVSLGDYNTLIGSENYISGATYGYGRCTLIGNDNTAADNRVTAVGRSNSGTAYGASLFGNNNEASGEKSIALGGDNNASGDYSTAAGYNNNATGEYSSAVGGENNVISYGSSAFGLGNQVSSNASIAAGYFNIINYDSYGSVAIGLRNEVYGGAGQSIVAGYYNLVNNYNSMAIGNNNETNSFNNSAVGYQNQTSGNNASAFGSRNTVSANYSSAIGYDCNVGGEWSLATGFHSSAQANSSNSIGYDCLANSSKTTAIGYKAKTTVQNTVNIGGPIIVRRGENLGSTDYEPYAGTEVVLMSDVVEFTEVKNILLNGVNVGQTYKVIPADSSFFINEVGVIITGVNNLAYDPMIEMGTEDNAEGDIQRVQEVAAGGTGTEITFSFANPAAATNKLVGICAVEGTVAITATVNSNAMTLRSTHQELGMTVAVFTIDASTSYDSVTFSFDASGPARGIIIEYSGMLSDYYQNISTGWATSTTLLVDEVSANLSGLNPQAVHLGIFLNSQSDPLSGATNGFTIINQASFGSGSTLAIAEKISIDDTINVSLTSDNNVPYLSMLVAMRGYIVSSQDVINTGLALTDPAEGTRYIFSGDNIGGEGYPNVYNAHSFLWAGVTDAATVNEGGYLRGRFYWKGLLVANQ